MCYVNDNLDQGIELSRAVHQDGDDTSLQMDGYTDADHAGDFETAKSTNGWATGHDRRNAVTLSYIDWGSKLQTGVALSTGEAEYVACTYGTSKSSIPMQVFIEGLTGKPVFLNLWVDNTAAEYTTQSGETRKMRHMSKTQRVTAAFVNNLLKEREDDRRCQYIESKQNVADILTKALGRIDYARGLVKLNVKTIEEFESYTEQVKSGLQYAQALAAAEMPARSHPVVHFELDSEEDRFDAEEDESEWA